MNWLAPLLTPELIWVFVPITAIIGGITLALVKSTHSHRERMALIESGLHPNFPPENGSKKPGKSNKPPVFQDPQVFPKTG